jgi:hypothetical protein
MGVIYQGAVAAAGLPGKGIGECVAGSELTSEPSETDAAVSPPASQVIGE